MLLHYMVTFLCLFSCAAGFIDDFLDDLFKPTPWTIKFDFDLESNNVIEEQAITACQVTLFNYRRKLGLGPVAHTWYSGIRHHFSASLDIDVQDWIFLLTLCEDPAWIDRIGYDVQGYGFGPIRFLGRQDHLGWCLSANGNAHVGTSFQNRVDRRCYKIFAISPLAREMIDGGRSTFYGFDNDADWFAHEYRPYPDDVAPTRYGRRSLEEQGAKLLGTIEEEMLEPTTQEPLGTIENEMFQHTIPLTASDDAIMHVGAVKALMELEICQAKKEDCELKLKKVIEMATSKSEPIPMGSNDVLENTPLDVDLTNDVREGRRKL